VADNPTRVKGLATEITPLVRLNTHVPHYRGTVARLPSRRRGIAYETESWPYVPASQYRKWTAGGRRPVRLVVIHDMEFPETARAAEVIAHDFATRTAKNPGSAHINVDNDSIVQCVKDNDIAFAAPGANRDGIQIELAGFGSQTREQWLDNYSEALLQRGADAAAQYCLKYGIPPIHITNQQLAAGAKRHHRPLPGDRRLSREHPHGSGQRLPVGLLHQPRRPRLREEKNMRLIQPVKQDKNVFAPRGASGSIQNDIARAAIWAFFRSNPDRVVLKVAFIKVRVRDLRVVFELLAGPEPT
jgi:hypothetical protein